MNRFIFAFMLSFLVLSANTRAEDGGSRAQDAIDSAAICIQGGGGDGVPTPFTGGNQIAELADGENYVLVGTIEIRETESKFGSIELAYLVVDLDKQPWLANGRRKVDAGYPLMGPASLWKKYAGQTVKMAAVAHGSIERSSQSLASEYVIRLEAKRAQ